MLRCYSNDGAIRPKVNTLQNGIIMEGLCLSFKKYDSDVIITCLSLSRTSVGFFFFFFLTREACTSHAHTSRREAIMFNPVCIVEEAEKSGPSLGIDVEYVWRARREPYTRESFFLSEPFSCLSISPESMLVCSRWALGWSNLCNHRMNADDLLSSPLNANLLRLSIKWCYPNTDLLHKELNLHKIKCKVLVCHDIFPAVHKWDSEGVFF